MTDPVCYFGCSGRLNRTLLDLPDHPAPRLCERHSEAWGVYRACLIAQSNTIEWPADFWPFERKMREEMEKETRAVALGETRADGTEIQAADAVVGGWYDVPSGELERCVAIRNRGRGVQVGFASILETGADPDDVRWLQGKTPIAVASEIEVARLVRGICEDNKVSPVLRDAPFEICPRNGLLCSVCEAPQRETPCGATCENGHGGVPGRQRAEAASNVAQAEADELAANGYIEEAKIVLEQAEGDPGEVDPDLQAGGPGMTLQEIVESFPRAYDLSAAVAKILSTDEGRSRIQEGLAGLAAREAGILAVQGDAGVADPLRVVPVYHKSLHIDWRTPRPLFDSQVRRWGPFWLDAAATAENKLCEYHLGPGSGVDDAMTVDWVATPEIYAAYGENAYLNHPYSKDEKACTPDCAKHKCAERGYHLDHPIASSGKWMAYARDQVLAGAPRIVCLTKAAVETRWWRDAVRVQPAAAGKFLGGVCDPFGGPAAQFMDPEYPAAAWFEFRWENLIVDVVEIEGRVDFDRGGNDGSAGFPSAIVTFYRPEVES